MLGIAVGHIGMSYGDFCRLTPEEFSHIYKAYSDKSEGLYRDNWERMRLLACITIQPHVKNKLTPRGLFSFPWDDESKEKKPPITKEEALGRYVSLMHRLSENGGLQTNND